MRKWVKEWRQGNPECRFLSVARQEIVVEVGGVANDAEFGADECKISK